MITIITIIESLSPWLSVSMLSLLLFTYLSTYVSTMPPSLIIASLKFFYVRKVHNRYYASNIELWVKFTLIQHEIFSFPKTKKSIFKRALVLNHINIQQKNKQVFYTGISKDCEFFDDHSGSKKDEILCVHKLFHALFVGQFSANELIHKFI